jgi:hypothetical protein
MTWSPGYGTRVVTPAPQYRFRASVPYSHANMLIPGTQSAGWNRQTNMNYAPQAVLPIELRAVGKSLPGLNTAPPVYRDWGDWYLHVARAIYERWKIASVGPGEATLEITVYATHDVDCKLVGFAPVKDVKRDAKAESHFREAAIFAVNSLNRDPVFEFPQNSERPKKVTFDIELDHEVGGKPGCHITHMHKY